MFDIVELILENFKSYAGQHKIVFPKTAGLYFIVGLNEAEPGLGPNGAGKSTLLDAICWCLFGKTLRGLKGTDVVTWGQRTAHVAVTFKIGSNQFTIERKQSPNSLSIEYADGKGKPIDQDELQSIIGLTMDAFVYSVVAPQFGQSFFELSPSGKLGLFSQIMGLEFWLEKSKQAATIASDLAITVAREDQSITDQQAHIAAITTDIEYLTGKETEFEQQNAIVAEQISQQLIDIDDELAKLSVAKVAKRKELSIYEGELVKHQSDYDRFNTILDKYIRITETINSEILVLSAENEAAQTALRAISGLKGTCPTCLQKTDKAHLKIEQGRLSARRAELVDFMLSAKEELQANKLFLSKAESNANNISNKIKTVDVSIARVKAWLTGSVAEVRHLEWKQQSLNDSLANKTNPYSDLIKEKKNLLLEAAEKIKKLKTQLEKANAEHSAYSFWINGFKRLRLFIIENTLRSLELEINNSLTSLGLTGWQISLDVERENKSGGVTKGFVVFVRCPAHPEPVRWESWSGGESQRLQLAGDLGLANLIMLQAGLRSKIEFYDEPSEHLSTEGLLDLAETLHQRAVNEDKRIFLIDHHVIEFGDVAGVILVTKGAQGSAIKRAR